MFLLNRKFEMAWKPRQVLNFFLISSIFLPFFSVLMAESIIPVAPKGPKQIISDGETKALDEMDNFTRVNPGEFFMGSPASEYGRRGDEVKHLVKITNPFWISKFELTNREWNEQFDEDFKKGSPVFFLTDDLLDEISGTIGRKGDNYAILKYGDLNSEKIHFHQAANLMGSWEPVKGGRSYELINPKFPTFDDVVEKMDQLGCKRRGRLQEKYPVTRISYSQAVSFCWSLTNKWRQQNILPRGMVVRLPTEAEWEYACRGGSEGFCGLQDGDWLSGENANIDGSNRNYILDERMSKTSFIPSNRGSISQVDPTSPKYSANAWGIYDMHGNVMEWCYDYYGDYPTRELDIDPIGPIYGTKRVVRGGSFYRTAQECRSASRGAYEPSYRGSEIGMRIVIAYPVR